jgi:hypothetical protein
LGKAPITSQSIQPSIAVSEGDIFESRLDPQNALKAPDGTFFSDFSLTLEIQELGVFAIESDQQLVVTVLARSGKGHPETPGWAKSPQSPATLKLPPGKAKYLLVYPLLGSEYRVMVRSARPEVADFRLAFHRTYTGADDGSGKRFLEMTERLMASLEEPNRTATLSLDQAELQPDKTERAALPLHYSLPLDDPGRSFVEKKRASLQPFLRRSLCRWRPQCRAQLRTARPGRNRSRRFRRS